MIFLELDPAVRYEERQRGGVVKEWKDRAAMEFLQNAARPRFHHEIASKSPLKCSF